VPPAKRHQQARSRVAPALVIGVGASAGGLDAVSELLEGVAPETDAAFIVVQHLDPEHESGLATLLSRVTDMPVVPAEDGIEVRPDTVYVIQPGTDLVIKDDVLRTSPRSTARGAHPTIDRFLESLAADRGTSAVGVVLSGTGGDGTEGLRAVRAAEGVTFAQDPSSAAFAAMPQAAIDADVVDTVDSPGGIGRALSRAARYRPSKSEGALPAVDEALLPTVFDILEASSGVDFSSYKRATVLRRLGRRMAVRSARSLPAYVTVLQGDPGETRALARDLLIMVTSFFREAESLDLLRTDVLPRLLAGSGAEPLRFWVPGCGTGQEAYSLAMTVMEYLEDQGIHRELVVFASDVSDADIAAARAGTYPLSITEEVSEERLARFFVRSNGGYRIRESVRDTCVFARHDVTRDPPFSRVDLVSCRNLMIYFTPALQRRALTFFHYALRPGGFLLLGGSEGVAAARGLFASAHPRLPLFSRADVPSQLPAIRRTRTGGLGQGLSQEQESGEAPPDLRHDVESLLIERYAPVSVLVGPDMQILQFSGKTGRYLEPAPGEADLDVMRMIRDGLAPDLQAAIFEARATREPARRGGARLLDSDDQTPVVIEAIPLTRPGLEDLTLITFTAQPPLARSEDVAIEPPTDHDAADIAYLRKALAGANEAVRVLRREHSLATERLRTAVESSQSANEELQSMNEELATAQEELQATNEELTTVNEELRSRNAEQSVVNADLANLLESMSVPTIILDRQLRIRRYTENAVQLLHLIPADAGRPLTDIRADIDIPDMDKTLRRVLTSGKPSHVEAQSSDGRWYSMMLRAYRGADRDVDGIVVSFVDIDDLKRAQQDLERAAALGLALSAAGNVLSASGQFGVGMESALDAATQAVGATWCTVLLRGGDRWLASATSGRGGPKKGQTYDADEVLAVGPAAVANGVVIRSGKQGRGTIVSAPLSLGSGVAGAVTFGFERQPVTDVERQFAERLAVTLSLAIESSRRRDELEAIADERTAELQRALEDLERAARVKDRFLADMSHELRTPLNSIIGFSGVLLQGMVGSLAPEQCKQVEMIHSSGANLLELVNGILDLAAIESGVVEAECAGFPLSEVLSELRDQMAPSAASKGLRLRVSSRTTAVMHSDRGMIRQVLVNLVGNAIKFTQSGEVTVKARQGSGGEVAITVADTGPGVPADELTRILDPFVQLARSGEAKPAGTGLGLAISARVARQLGGRLTIESREGLGLTCLLQIPRCLEPAASAPPRPEARPGRASRSRAAPR